MGPGREAAMDGKIAAVMAQMEPAMVPRPHRHFDGDYGIRPAAASPTPPKAGPRHCCWSMAGTAARATCRTSRRRCRGPGAQVVAPRPLAHDSPEGETLSAEDAAAAILAVAGPRGSVRVMPIPSAARRPWSPLEAVSKTAALVFFAPPLRQIDQFRRRTGKFGLAPDDRVLARPRAAGSTMDAMDLGAKRPAGKSRCLSSTRPTTR